MSEGSDRAWKWAADVATVVAAAGLMFWLIELIQGPTGLVAV